MSTYDPENIFQKIMKGELPCKKVLETERSLAFQDAFPKAPVHILVIPKGEYQDYSDFMSRSNVAEKLDFWDVVQAVIKEKNLEDKGYRLITNMGGEGGQEVYHFHVHILAGKPLGPLVAQ